MRSRARWKAIAAAALIGAAVAAAALFWRGEAPPPAPGSQVWRYSVWGPPRPFTKGIETAKAILEEAGQGAFALEIHYASALVPIRQYLDSIKLGVIEAGTICVGYHPAKLPLAQVMELPFLLPNDIGANARIMDAVFRHPSIEAELAQRWNSKYLMIVILPAYEFMGNRPIAGVADLKGLRMRISGANSLVLEEFGAVPTMVTAPEAYTALERGTVDAVGFPWTFGFGSYRLFEVSKYVTLGIAMSGFACFAAVSLDAWNALPERMKALLPEIRERSNAAMLRAYEEADTEWLPVFRERLEILQFPPADREAMMAKAEPLWERWVADMEAKGMAGREILEFTQTQIAKYAP